MTSFDLLVLAVLALSIGFAVIRGALRELGTLLALGLAAVAAFALLKPLQNVFGLGESFVSTTVIVGAVSLLGFLLLYVLLHLALRRLALTGPAAKTDRIAGGVFGLVRGLALIGLGFLAYSYYLGEERRPEGVKTALTLPLAKGIAGLFADFAPAPIENAAPARSPADVEGANPAIEGYARGDRSALSEIMTTVTTDGAENDERTGAERDGDPIADAIKRESTPE